MRARNHVLQLAVRYYAFLMMYEKAARMIDVVIRNTPGMIPIIMMNAAGKFRYWLLRYVVSK